MSRRRVYRSRPRWQRIIARFTEPLIAAAFVVLVLAACLSRSGVGL